MAKKPYRDPTTTKIEDWKWRPLEQIKAELSMREIPDYIQKGFGGFMNEQAGRAKKGAMTPRDLIKAYTIAQSSIGRGGLSHSTASKMGMKLPNTGGEVRPEGAFAEWLGSPEGQRYLDLAQQGQVDPAVIADLQYKFAPFGKQNDQATKMVEAAHTMPAMAGDLNRVLVGSPEEYRDFAEKLKGIAGAKSGFIGSLLGRGDLPTLDARQLNLHTRGAPVGVGSIMNRGKGKGAREAVDRLAARQTAMGLDIDPALAAHYQHLAHHAVWDKTAGAKTTHEDLIRAMRGYADGGPVNPKEKAMAMMAASRAKALQQQAIRQQYDKAMGAQLPGQQIPQPQWMQQQGIPKLAGGSMAPELLDRNDPQYQALLAKFRSGERLGADDNIRVGLSHPVSAVKLREPIHELTYKERPDPNQPMVPEKYITPEHLYKGAGIGLIGDAARLAMLTHVGKEKLPKAVRLQAGVNFMRGIKPKGESSAWASGPAVISDLSNKVTEGMKLPGVERMFGLHASMTPTGVDFGRPLSKVLVGQLKNNPPKKETMDLFNTVMQMDFPEFAGVHNPDELHAQLVAPGARSAAMRKAFVKLMDKAPFQNAGMPNVGHARVAISDPEQLHLPTHSIGLGISELDPTGKVIKNPSMPHEDYEHHLGQKEYAGRFEVPMSRSDVFSDFNAARRAAGKEPTDDPRSFDFSTPIQVFNQQWLDTIMPKYLAKRKLLTGKAEGGHVGGCGCSTCGPTQDEMLAHVMLRKASGGPVDIKKIGVDEAPDMDVKEYMSPSGPGFPVGGVDFQPQLPGQQILPAAPGQPGQAPGQMPQMPGQTGQVPQGGAPQGGPPMPPFGQPRGPQSNILAMTPQGQAMQAMRPNPAAMPRMATGGTVKSSIPTSGALTTLGKAAAAKAPIDYSRSRFFNPVDPFAAGRALEAQYPKSPVPNMSIYGGRYADELSTPAGTAILANDVNNVAANTGADKIYKPHDLDLLYGGDMNDPTYQQNYARLYWNGNSYFVPDTLEVDPHMMAYQLAGGKTKEEQEALFNRLSGGQGLMNRALGTSPFSHIYADNGTPDQEGFLREFLQKKEKANYGMPNPLNQGQGRDAAMKELYHDYGGELAAFDVGRGDLTYDQGWALQLALEQQKTIDSFNANKELQKNALKRYQDQLAGLTVSNGNTQSYDQNKQWLQGMVDNYTRDLGITEKNLGKFQSNIDPYLQTVSGIQNRDKLSSADVLKYWFPQQVAAATTGNTTVDPITGAATGATTVDPITGATVTKMAKGGSTTPSVQQMRQALANRKKPVIRSTTHEIQIEERPL